MLSDAIISMLIVSATGLIALTIKLCYMSKCKVIKCCPPECVRDTEHEARITIEPAGSPTRI
jgi:hypothetical protein